MARDETIVRVHLVPTVGSRALATITPADVVTAWASASAPRTVRRQYGVLRAILNAAVAAELIARSPCRSVRYRPSRRRPGTSSTLTSWRPSPTPWATTGRWRTSAVLGLRWGECAGLRVGRLDFLRSTLEVAEHLTRGPRGAMVMGPLKSPGQPAHSGRPGGPHGLLGRPSGRRG
ncbi:MAG: hypothetical protein ABR540_12590, partial [Acidimicrobiales bacterium]